MRTLKRNKQKVWYWLFKEDAEILTSDNLRTGELRKTYYEPQLIMSNVSPATGNASVEGFGIAEEYSHVMVVENETPIQEDTIIWVGEDPSTATEGFYRVVRIAKSLNHTRIALRETEYTAPYTGEEVSNDGSDDNSDGT